MASSVSVSLNPFTAALSVIFVIMFMNRPRLTVSFGLVFGFAFLVARRVRRRQGIRGSIREQIAQIRDNGIMERSFLGDLDRAVDLLLDEYIIDRFMGPEIQPRTLSSKNLSRRESNKSK